MPSTERAATPRRRSIARIARAVSARLSLRRDERGVVVVIVALSMLVFLGMAGLAIDIGGWYGTQRHAQATADAAALAAANAMTGGATTTAANTAATTIVTDNDSTITSPTVTFDTVNDKVTVRITTTSRAYFSQALGISSPSVGATSVAKWAVGSGVLYSLFAGNAACGTADGIIFASAGGGNSNVTGIHSNGQLVNNAHSNATYTGTISSSNASGTNVTPTQAACTGSSWNSKNTTLTSSGSTALPFPLTYTQPTGSACTRSASSFTTAQITGPGVYCATGANTSCANGSANGAGSIYLNQLETGVELVAACVVLAGGAGNSTSPSGQPLVYGTAGKVEPPATSVWIDNNGNVLAGTVYVPNGTVEFTQNNDVTTFVEAWNIKVDGNNFTVTGNGPATLPGADSLTG